MGVDGPPPPNLDWDLWQGPRPRRSYRSNLVHYNWHWFWHWGTGELCNNAVHEVDIARWLMGVEFPERVSARGERRFYKGDDWEMYDTLRLELTFGGGRMIRWDGHSCNAVSRYDRGRGTLICRRARQPLVCMWATSGSVVISAAGIVTSRPQAWPFCQPFCAR